MDINRKTAYQVLADIEKKKSYFNILLNYYIIINKPNNQAFVRRLVYGVLENKILLDYVIDKLIPKDISSLKVADLIILRMGVYQLAKMDSVPEYAAVNESVRLAKRYARGRSGFINGVLRAYIVDAALRFTFGNNQLLAGVDILPVLIGMFALSEIMVFAENRGQEESTISIDVKNKMRGFGFTVAEFMGQMINFLRSALIGKGIGILPGLGGSTANLIAYSIA